MSSCLLEINNTDLYKITTVQTNSDKYINAENFNDVKYCYRILNIYFM